MPVQWTISHSKRLVLAVARSPAAAADIETYLHSVALAGGMPYAKIFSIVDVEGVLSAENMAALAGIVRHYALYGRIGPIAIVAPFDRGYRQARLFADAATADRPLAIFRELHEARRWIDSITAARTTEQPGSAA
ncbi:MAG: hypothetical protein JOY64_14815 [Alphaproteobacteria bacterium]|nr:hypothetical protein [Alphaproteobacteria bacterium]MBV8408902.1 hypothetical protein [Alphaproteobacteria bacterium]